MQDWLPGPTVATVATSLFAAAAAISWAWRSPRQVVRHGVAVLVAAAVLTVIALAAIVRPHPLGTRVRLDPSEEPMIAHDEPARAAYDEAVGAFGDDDVFIVGMRTDDVFTSAQ